jgi:nitrite reductase/ring-hydroxylating ferredoxin subunit
VEEIALGKMKEFNVKGTNVLIANVDGKFHAISNHCGHMRAPLSMGSLNNKVVTCCLHGAQFDVTSGKKLRDGKVGFPPEVLAKFPKEMLAGFEFNGKVMARVDTMDQPKYETKVEDGKVFVALQK